MSDPAPRPIPVPVTIRDCGSDDLDLIMEIMSAAFEPTYGEAWTRSQCAGILPMAGVTLRLPSAPMGRSPLCLAARDCRRGRMLLIAVAPAAQQTGIGAAWSKTSLRLRRQAGRAASS